MCLLTLFIVFIFNSVVGNVLQVEENAWPGSRQPSIAEVLSILGSLVGMLLSVWIGIARR